MDRKIYLLASLLLICFWALYASKDDTEISDFSLNYILNQTKILPEMQFEFLGKKDTFFVQGDNYIEVSLKRQVARVVSRNDSGFSFKISSGNPALLKGEETPTGIFTVQEKSPLAISKQFKNAELYNWIGFNGNVGFHGLKGNGYYSLLGKRASSHGCIRITREDGEKLYKKVKTGTPVIVFDSEPARILAFSKDTIKNMYDNLIITKKNRIQDIFLRNRLVNLYKGDANRLNKEKIYLDGRTILKPGGYDIGKEDSIYYRQYRKIEIDWNKNVKADNVKINSIEKIRSMKRNKT